MDKKILAVVSEPVSADALRSAMGGDADDAEVLVVAPALMSRRHFLLEPDARIERAEGEQEEPVERLEEQRIPAAGHAGEADPRLAIQDALVSYEADEIVLFSHAEGSRNWLEEGLVEAAKERFEAPVRHLVVE